MKASEAESKKIGEEIPVHQIKEICYEQGTWFQGSKCAVSCIPEELRRPPSRVGVDIMFY